MHGRWSAYRQSKASVRVVGGRARCGVWVAMAQVAEKTRWIELRSQGKANGAETLDLAIKSLIDDLIVPYLVEEFLRLYGPATVAKLNDKSPESQPDSELNSTP
jgi:hypothetical protein